MRAGFYRSRLMASLAGFAMALLGLTVPLFGNEENHVGLKMSPQGPVVSVEAVPGEFWSIEATSDLLKGWDMLASFRMEGPMSEWLDQGAAGVPYRFYRSAKLPGEPVATYAENFRLIDHTGRARELFYHWGDPMTNAIVLIFSSLDCSEVAAQKAVLTQLQTEFGAKGVWFWLVESKPGTTRAQIANLSAQLGLPWPILQDRAQSVSKGYRAEHALEAVAISTVNMNVFYRGAISKVEPMQGGGAQTMAHLKNALTQHLAGAAILVAATQSAGCGLPIAPPPALSYSSDIAPILQAKCVTCHTPGNVAPWSMTNYAIVKAYASSIKEQVMSREMPPWHADPEYGKFSNDISLSIEQEQKLLAWIAQGASRGEGADPLEQIPPPAPKWPTAWGEPDMVIKAPMQTIKATGIEAYRYIYVKSGIPSNVWVKAALVRPSNTAVVHHYIVWEGFSNSQQASGIAGYVPGTPNLQFPSGTGILLNKDVDLTFNLHYTPNGSAQQDQPELALWFHKTPPPKMYRALPVAQLSLQILPQAREHPASIQFSLPADITVYRMAPHMHVRGLRMKYEITVPGGVKETLLSVPNYNFQWQTTYQLATPRFLPRGTLVNVSGAFDNSTLNIHNPDPTETVRWGEQSWEEMFIGYVDYTQ